MLGKTRPVRQKEVMRTVVLNRSDADRSVGGLPAASFEDLLSGQAVSGPNPSVAPRSARILVAK